MEEIWKIITYSPEYQVSNLGNIKNIKKNKKLNINYERLKKTNTRARVSLKVDNKRKEYYLHRVVAEHFIDNPNNLIEVNHKNGDFYDNKANNLEWISKNDNMRHAVDNNLINKFKRKIIVKTKSTKEEKIFDSLTDCANILNCSIGHLSSVCNNKIKSKKLDDFEISYLDIQKNDSNFQEKCYENIIWKPYPELDKYLVSNTGEIKHKRTNRIVNGSKINGYRFVNLQRDDGVKMNRLVHRLVAETFLENPENKPVVNHKDTNILNNNLSNLEWVTYKENMNTKETIDNLKKGKNSKNILQIDIESGNILHKFYGASEAVKNLNINTTAILSICNFYKGNCSYSYNVWKTYKKKYIFIFEDDQNRLTDILKIAKIYVSNNTTQINEIQIDNRKKTTIQIDKRKKTTIQIDKETNQIINSFESGYDASKKLNIQLSGINQCCHYYKYNDNDRPICYKLKTFKGFIFKQVVT